MVFSHCSPTKMGRENKTIRVQTGTVASSSVYPTWVAKKNNRKVTPAPDIMIIISNGLVWKRTTKVNTKTTIAKSGIRTNAIVLEGATEFFILLSDLKAPCLHTKSLPSLLIEERPSMLGSKSLNYNNGTRKFCFGFQS